MNPNLSSQFDAEDEASKSDSVASVVDLLNLTPPEQKLFNWIARHKAVNLTEMIAYLNEDAETVKTLLDSLTQQGFIQCSEREGELYYSTQRAAKKRSRASENLWQQL